jgi:hypothetical protein
MPHIPMVPSTPTTIQVFPEVTMLRDMMHLIIDRLKWIKKLVCLCIVVVVYPILTY